MLPAHTHTLNGGRLRAADERNPHAPQLAALARNRAQTEDPNRVISPAGMLADTRKDGDAQSFMTESTTLHTPLGTQLHAKKHVGRWRISKKVWFSAGAPRATDSLHLDVTSGRRRNSSVDYLRRMEGLTTMFSSNQSSGFTHKHRRTRACNRGR